MRSRLAHIATHTPIRPSWMRSRTCSALINEFTHAAFSNQISKDEARWAAANIAKLPKLLRLIIVT
jgi:hypothetical protein